MGNSAPVKHPGSARMVWGAILTGTFLLGGMAPAAELTDEERTGERIFRGGIGAQGMIAMRIGPTDMRLAANVLSCAACHGPDGSGRDEGGVAPPNITWANLTKPYDQRQRSGRVRSPYNDVTLFNAVTRGIDSGGIALDAAMPRFELSPPDLRALIAYLKRLDDAVAPGVTEQEILVGTLLPERGPHVPVADAIERLLNAYFDEINRSGGVHGRRISVVARRYADAQSASAALRQLAEQDRAFVLVAPLLAGVETDVGQAFDHTAPPVLGPVLPFSPLSGRGNVFHLVASVEDQARALVDFAARGFPQAAALRMVVRADPRFSSIADAVRQRCAKLGWRCPSASSALDEDDAPIVYLGGAAGLAELIRAVAHADGAPAILTTAASVDGRVLDAARSGGIRLFAAYSLLRDDQSAAAVAEIRSLHARNAIPLEHAAAQSLAYGAAKLFVEAVGRAGRALSRDRLIAALEGLRGFETGVTRPLTYGPNRRVGSLGAHIVAIGAGAAPEERQWIGLE